MMLFAAASKVTEAATPAAGLDYGYLAFVAAILVPLGLAWIYANRRLSNFNSENHQKKKNTEEQLSRNIYREGTAPLVMTVNSYISEQVIPSFSEAEQEIILRYEESKAECIDPSRSSFIDLSNFADTIQYDQKVEILIDAHAAIEKHNENYRQMRKNLKNLAIVCWFPIILVLSSLVLHFAGFVLFQDTGRFSYLVQTTLVIGLFLSVPTIAYYVRYMSCVKRVDFIGVDGDE